MIRRAVFWSFFGQFISLSVSFVGAIIIARLLTPREMGVYAVAVATTGILQIFTSFGVGSYVVREKDLLPETLDAAFTVNAILSITLSAILFFSSYVGAYYLREPAVARVLQLLSLTPLISVFSFRPSIMLQRAMLFRGASILGTISAALTSGVTILAALAGASYLSPAYGSLASATATAVGFSVIGREHASVRVSLRDWRRMVTFGLRIMSIGGIANVAVRVSDIILGHFLGLAALGLYSRATNIVNLVNQNVYTPATRIVFVQLSAAQRDDDRITSVFLRGLQMIIGVVGPVIMGLAVLARPAVLTLYGEKWMGAADPLSLLLMSQFISLSFAMNWELFVVRDELKIQTRLEVTRSIVGMTTQLIGCMFNLVVVAATGIVDSLISVALYGPHMTRLAGASSHQLRRIYAEGLLLTCIAVAPSVVLMASTGWSARVSLVAVGVSVVIGAASWLLALRQFSHPLADEIVVFTRRALAIANRAKQLI